MPYLSAVYFGAPFCMSMQLTNLLTSITPFVGDVRASEIVSLARAKLRRGTSNNLCTAPY